MSRRTVASFPAVALIGLACLALVSAGPAAAAPPAAPPAAAGARTDKTDLFIAGDGGYVLHRIPGLVVTAKGTLLAYCEARKTGGDWAAIDVSLRRSTDGGKTWEPARRLVEAPKVAKNPAAVAQKLGKEGEVTVNNPVAIADKSGAVHFVYCVEYGRCYYMRSDDDGRTFSDPVEITAALEKLRPEYDWKILATGPGHGIQLDSGRLLVPVWLSAGTGGGAHRPSCVATIYSDDAGKTWKAGEIVARNPEPLANPNETAAVQLPDGRVMLNIRHETKVRLRAVCVGPDGAKDWGPIEFDRELPEPVCQGSLVRWRPGAAGKDAEPDLVLFSNPHNPDGSDRRNLMVKASRDSGRTWPLARTIEAGIAGYSDLAVGPDGAIYCFYERAGADGRGTKMDRLTVARFSVWLLLVR